MKKLLVYLLAGAMALSFTACVQTADTTAQSSSSSISEESDAPSATEEPVDSPDAEAPTPENPIIRISTTTSVNDSGLLPYLQPVFEADTGYKMEVTSAGTGAAIEKGRTGDADMLLVHAKASEEEFVAEGFATERLPFMYNFFVIVGPESDPAGVASAENATAAFKAIANGGYGFISRGDDSGTHKAELKIWDAAGISPDPAANSWYVSAGDGMGACLNMAAEQQAYVLTDKATYLAHGQREKLTLLLEKSDEMKNTYAMLALSTDKWPETNTDGTQAFIDWMTSEKATKLINEFGVVEYGEQLFFTGA